MASWSKQTAVPGAADSLIPLARAVELIATEIYRDNRARSRSDVLDDLAYALSVVSPMFVIDSPPRKLREPELAGGRFRNGGTEMHFSDGRSSLREIAVTTDAIAKVIRVLKDSQLDR